MRIKRSNNNKKRHRKRKVSERDKNWSRSITCKKEWKEKKTTQRKTEPATLCDKKSRWLTGSIFHSLGRLLCAWSLFFGSLKFFGCAIWAYKRCIFGECILLAVICDTRALTNKMKAYSLALLFRSFDFFFFQFYFFSFSVRLFVYRCRLILTCMSAKCCNK